MRDFFNVAWKPALVVFLIALAVRLPYFWHPPSIVFDEGLYATYTQQTALRQPYFDIHPPLAKLIFAGVAGAPKALEKLYEVGSSFGNFPYYKIRFLNVFLGSLLAVVIFFIAKRIYTSWQSAFLVGLFIALDNALVTYSRIMLPDTLLLVLGFSGVLLLLENYFILSMIAFGLAVSVKWTGIGFFLAGGALLFLTKGYRKIFVGFLIVFVIYLAIFVIFFSLFPKTEMDHARYWQDFLNHINFPGPDLGAIIKFLPQHHLLMLKANITHKPHANASPPYSWPLLGSMPLWDAERSAKILLMGNIAGWVLVALTMLFLGTVFVLRFFGHKSFLFTREEKFLLAAFFINYLPFFFVSRPMFIYHYFAALIFGYLLLPRGIWIAADIFHADEKKLRLALILLAVFSFLVTASFTYGVKIY